MARALGTGGITSTSAVAPFFFASVSCYSPDGLVLHRPKHVPAFLRSQFLTRIQRPSSRVLALAPSALYYPSLSSSFCVRMPRSAPCLRLGLAVLHGFGLPAAAQGRLPRDSVEAAGASTRCMAASTEKDLETWIRKTNSSQPIVVWSKTYCPYSIRVKKLFDKLGYDFQGIELDELNDEDGVQDALERISGLSTVPNVYIGGKHIGGCDDTVALHMRGELIPLLIAAGANKK
jgi:glutaredoxin 3